MEPTCTHRFYPYFHIVYTNILYLILECYQSVTEVCKTCLDSRHQSTKLAKVSTSSIRVRENWKYCNAAKIASMCTKILLLLPNIVAVFTRAQFTAIVNTVHVVIRSLRLPVEGSCMWMLFGILRPLYYNLTTLERCRKSSQRSFCVFPCLKSKDGTLFLAAVQSERAKL